MLCVPDLRQVIALDTDCIDYYVKYIEDVLHFIENCLSECLHVTSVKGKHRDTQENTAGRPLSSSLGCVTGPRLLEALRPFF